MVSSGPRGAEEQQERGGRHVLRHSARGFPYWVWEPAVPRIRDEYLDCAIYLYRSKHEALEGIGIGGSGFLLSVPAERLPPPQGFIYAVTNRHVVPPPQRGDRSDVFLVGRFINHEGQQRNAPTLRFGLIAQMPGDPIRVESNCSTHPGLGET